MRQERILLFGLSLVLAGGIGISEAQAQSPVQPQVRLSTTINPQSNSFQYPTSLTPRTSFQSPKRSKAAVGDGVEIFGDVLYSYSWTQWPYPHGIYSFESVPGFELLRTSETLENTFNGGACLSGDYYYGVYYMHRYSGNYTAGTFYKYDAKTWQLLESKPISDMIYVALDLTSDPTDGTLYGIFYNENLTSYTFGTIDYETMTRTIIADLGSTTYLVTLAADSNGHLYGVGNDNAFYRINKVDGSLTKIGDTGVNGNPWMAQSACCDPRTGRFYWAAYLLDYISGLYEVDTQTGEGILIDYFPYSEQITGLFIPEMNVDEHAPGDLQSFTLQFDQASLDGQATLQLPITDFSGRPYSGELTYSVCVDDEIVATGKSESGDQVVADLHVSQGKHVFTAYVSNEAGNGPVSKIRRYVGNDVPVAVSNLYLEVQADSVMSLTWQAPAASVNKGYFDADALTYRVVRYPEQVVVADALTDTSFVEILQVEYLNNYWYEVCAECNGQSSEYESSNKVVLGQYVGLPYYCGFDSDADFALYTVIDQNQDATTWSYYMWNGDVSISASYFADADDWLITPGIKLEANRLYSFSFSVRDYYDYYTETLAVSMGQSPTVEDMVIEVMPATDFTSSVPQTLEFNISVQTEGVYYIGFNSLSKAGNYVLALDDIRVEAGAYFDAPAAPQIAATPAGGGKLEVQVSVTAPTCAVNGSSISSMSKLELYRDNLLIKTFDNPEPAQTFEFLDQEANQGFNTYSAYAYSVDGSRGDMAKLAAYAGIDAPGSPTNIRIQDLADHIILTWDAPTEGKNQGYIVPDELTYNIEEVYGTRIDGVTGTSVEIYPAVNNGSQYYLYYNVTACNAYGSGDAAKSQTIVFGAPYQLPFLESFANGQMQNSFWGNQISRLWYIGGENVIDDDGGSTQFVPSNIGDVSVLQSGKICLSSVVRPCLDFYYLTDVADGVRLQAEIWSCAGDTVVVFDSDSLQIEGDWVKVHADLSQFRNLDFVHLCFRCTSVDGETPLTIDDISIENGLDYDLSATVVAPKIVDAGQSADIQIQVTNEGYNTATDYFVNLFIDDVLVQQYVGEPVESKQTQIYNHSFQTNLGSNPHYSVYAVVEWNLDEGIENNTTQPCAIAVTLPAFPAITDLSGSLSYDVVELTWSKPDSHDGTSILTTDGFEEYESFIKDNIGEWTLVDIDGSTTYGITSTTDYPNNRTAMAYQVFEPVAAGLDIEQFTNYAPHSGSKYLASFDDTDGQNDDWLISPKLSGQAQNVSFFVKSANSDFGLEKYQLYYSLSDTDIEHMLPYQGEVSTYQAPVEWTEVVMELPEGARYFAVRCVSTNSFLFMLDDFAFVPESNHSTLMLLGYNVYRDGQKINDSLVETETYTDIIGDNDTYRYAVTAVYDLGESVFSNIVTINPGIDDISQIVGVNDEVAIYSLSGQLLYRGNVIQPAMLPDQTDVVIIVARGKSYKYVIGR